MEEGSATVLNREFIMLCTTQDARYGSPGSCSICQNGQVKSRNKSDSAFSLNIRQLFLYVEFKMTA